MFSVLHLPGARFAEVSLERLAQEDEQRRGTPEKSRLLDAGYCQRLIDQEHARLNVTHSYGDYLVSRRHAWRGHYQERDQKFVHLGLDIVAETGTPVLAPFDALVVHRDIDRDQDGGWGARVFLKPVDKRRPVLLLAHLDADSLVERGRMVGPGTVLGVLARPDANGGWFAHLHAQAIERTAWPHVHRTLALLDGYCRADEVEKLKTVFPDPTPYIRKP